MSGPLSLKIWNCISCSQHRWPRLRLLSLWSVRWHHCGSTFSDDFLRKFVSLSDFCSILLTADPSRAPGFLFVFLNSLITNTHGFKNLRLSFSSHGDRKTWLIVVNQVSHWSPFFQSIRFTKTLKNPDFEWWKKSATPCLTQVTSWLPLTTSNSTIPRATQFNFGRMVTLVRIFNFNDQQFCVRYKLLIFCYRKFIRTSSWPAKCTYACTACDW